MKQMTIISLSVFYMPQYTYILEKVNNKQKIIGIYSVIYEFKI